MPSLPDNVDEDIVFLGSPFVRSSGQILLLRYLMNGLSNLETYVNIY